MNPARPRLRLVAPSFRTHGVQLGSSDANAPFEHGGPGRRAADFRCAGSAQRGAGAGSTPVDTGVLAAGPSYDAARSRCSRMRARRPTCRSSRAPRSDPRDGLPDGHGSNHRHARGEGPAGVKVQIILDVAQTGHEPEVHRPPEGRGRRRDLERHAFQFMHAKMMVVDESEAVISTGNYAAFRMTMERNFVVATPTRRTSTTWWSFSMPTSRARTRI